MKQFKTIRDLFNVVGEKPFVWRFNDMYSDMICLNQFVKLNDDSLLELSFQDQENFVEIKNVKLDQGITFTIELLDWFEETNVKTSNLCNCDFIKLLQLGCKCGGQ